MRSFTQRGHTRWFAVLAASVFAVSVLQAAGVSAQSGSPGAAQEITVAGPVALVDLDPHGANALEDPTQQLDRHIFDSVVTRSAGGIKPHLATSWTNTDPLTWTFTIRDDVKFTNGQPLTAADVKASLDRVVTLQGPLAPLWAALDTVEAPDATTLVVKTKTPMGDMLNNMSLLYVVPAALADTQDFFLKPIGSGPFMVDSFTPNQDIVIVKNPDYWDGPPTLDKITFKEIPDVSARVTALTTGEIDSTWELPPDQLATVQSDTSLTVQTSPSLAFYYQWFNSKRAPFTDPHVRQALWYGLDVKTITEALFPGAATVAQAPITSNTFGFQAQTPYEYNPDKAKELLTEAGFPNGFDTTIQYATTCCAQIDQLVQAMVSDWAKIGVNVTPLPKEQATWVDDLLKLNWDMNIALNETVTGSANFTIGRLYTCTAGPNGIGRMGYCNPDLDKIIAEAQQELDLDKQAALWAQAEKIIWDDAVGISLFDLTQNYENNNRIQGFTPPESGFPFYYPVSVSQ